MTCTTRNAVSGICGKPAVYTEESRISPGVIFAECAECAAAPNSMAATRRMVGVDHAAHRVGDHVDVHRCGKVYDGVVVEVGARGAVYAEFTYDNGARRRVRV